MTLFRFQTKQALPVSLEEGWSFFSDPRNLSAITPPWLTMEVTSDLPARMYPGLIITYRIRPVLGLAMDWVSEITHVDEPFYFVDEQRFGPYRFWHHQHHFRAIEGGIACVDTVHYALPPVPFSGLLNRAMVRRKLAEIFAFRRERLEARFGRHARDEGPETS